MKRKWLVAVVLALLIGAISGIRHERRNPNQHLNQYWAVRELTVWWFFGREVYANGRLAVYDMSGGETSKLPMPINAPPVHVRRFGAIVQGDDQFNLGEDLYRSDACVDYILGALAASGDARHRLEAAACLNSFGHRCPSLLAARDGLLNDPDEKVRSVAARETARR